MFRKNIKTYANSLYNNGAYKFSEFGNSTILSTSFAVSTLYLNNLSIQKIDDTKKYLLSALQEDGYFIDKNFDHKNNNSYHKNDYTIPQFTFFSLIALDILGVNNISLKFMDHYLNINNLKSWFENLNWATFWYESNKIMFMMYFLSYLIKYDFTRKDMALICMEECFNILDKKQDKNTGFWGTDINNNNMMDGLAGAAHIYFFYDFYNKEIKYKDKIIDSLLSFHKDILIGSVEGGACEDYDAIECYYRIFKQSCYRKEDIINKLSKMKKIIKKMQQKDGGYPYSFYNGGNTKLIYNNINELRYYKYSSWDYMSTPIHLSDIWGTYFRTMSLKVIDKILLNKKNYRSYHLPGWGFI